MNPPEPDWPADRQAITDLVHQYCYAVAAEDIQGIVRCFTHDATMDVLGDVHQGHDGLRSMYAVALRSKPKPFIHNLIVERRDTGSAVGRCVAQIIREADASTGYGRYDDTFVRTPDGWRFASRSYTRY